MDLNNNIRKTIIEKVKTIIAQMNLYVNVLKYPGYIINGDSLSNTTADMPIWYTPMYFMNRHLFSRENPIADTDIKIKEDIPQLKSRISESDPILEILGLF